MYHVNHLSSTLGIFNNFMSGYRSTHVVGKVIHILLFSDISYDVLYTNAEKKRRCGKLCAHGIINGGM